MLYPIPLIFLILALVAMVSVWGVFAQRGGFDEINAAIGRNPSTGIIGLQHYPGLDRSLMSMVVFNLPVVGNDPVFHAGRNFMVQFLANVAIIPTILMTEDARAVPGSAARYSTAWGFFSQMATSAVMCPLYAFWFTIQNDAKDGVNARHPMPSRVVIPSVLIGYGIPAVMVFDPFQWGLHIQVRWILAFIVFPLGVFLMGHLLTSLLARCKRLGSLFLPTPTESHYPTVRYVAVGAVAMMGHLWYLWKNCGDSAGIRYYDPPSHAPAAPLVFLFLQIDYVLTFAAMLLLAYHELTRRHIVQSPWLAVGGLVVGWLFLGPGATLAGAWALREQRIARPQNSHGQIEEKHK